MEELGTAWVRMTKLLHAIQAQANDIDVKMNEVKALLATAASPAPSDTTPAPKVANLHKKRLGCPFPSVINWQSATPP